MCTRASGRKESGKVEVSKFTKTEMSTLVYSRTIDAMAKVISIKQPLVRHTKESGIRV